MELHWGMANVHGLFRHILNECQQMSPFGEWQMSSHEFKQEMGLSKCHFNILWADKCPKMTQTVWVK